jgi:hypothetical protein
MPNLSGLPGLLKNLQNGQQYLLLALPIPGLPHRPSIGIFDGCLPWNSDGPVEFVGRREDDRGKPSLLQESCSLSNGPAAEGSGRRQKHGVNALLPHLF